MCNVNALPQQYDPAKLRELIVYVSLESLGDRHFGKTKLNKILFFSDFTAYRETGRSISGAVYQHLAQGPGPHQLLPVLNTMTEDVTEFAEPVGSVVQKRLVPLRAADLSAFTGPEIAIVNSVLDDLAPLTNKQVSDVSHETIAWRITQNGQEIPYGTALLSGDEPTHEDLDWVKGIVDSAELDRATT